MPVALAAVGFSSGCAEFIPWNPPPFVPSILIGMTAAAGPTNDVLRLGLALIVGAHRGLQ
jgi:hypothetical protein